MDYSKEALRLHKEWNGKLETVPKMKIENKDDLSVAYTPGVAAPCLAIKNDPKMSYVYTGRKHTVAVVTDGSAILGLGNIGPEAGMPVMEGKCVLFKAMAGLDAVPIALATQDTDELVDTIARLEPSFGGINLEDIAAPRCFEVEKRLQERMNIPVFHDDQHGTAIVVCSALVNALRVVHKTNPTIVINGAGSAGCAIADLILRMELGQVILVDRAGILTPDMDLTSGQRNLIDRLNPEHKTGTLADALKGADVFVGVSAGHIVSQAMIASMNQDAIVFPMANPVPEIEPDEASAAGARIVGTGRSDHANQINNLLAFPGIFKGALEAEATCINYEMQIAAVYAIASMVPEDELNETNIIVSALQPGVSDVVAQAVADAARKTGVIRKWE
ncbi:NAD(P)-dependent malic enzyme [Catenisphaera adipataccumulans]|uniref:Malate dehydrogenase (Oxaloacetate-decarboxylating) n=1 Tax=Catenisphaera adipataccumulans TaxID=700500 RepID=A0A7W8CXZ4_9FIRM|nr:NADP-dependent malic enzyme [Catenisphaera adipataccumulans]MBB5182939.1 malate dehydrogenase (oxaloacetate-decarboxylating) [Catenisphaera adipataccumulans]